jgi:hypothetical protein
MKMKNCKQCGTVYGLGTVDEPEYLCSICACNEVKRLREVVKNLHKSAEDMYSLHCDMVKDVRSKMIQMKEIIISNIDGHQSMADLMDFFEGVK